MSEDKIKAALRNIPGVDTILAGLNLAESDVFINQRIVTSIIREILADERQKILKGRKPRSGAKLIEASRLAVMVTVSPPLKNMINATGIVIHTNIGRSPMGKRVYKELAGIVDGYCNLEFDLDSGKRGSRHDLISGLLKSITGAEDALVVNNNASSLFLILSTLAKRKQVIISRGELIEIGDSFRLPEIMKASGAKMVEVGTTNMTHPSDYINAITPSTAMILKAHRSNFSQSGFTEEVSVKEASKIAHENDIPMVYDLGSGLIKKPAFLPVSEPDALTSLEAGADLICFSGDKLLGGPQAGIVAGKAALIKKLKKAPLMRILRVDKMTLAALASVLKCHADESTLVENIPIYGMLDQSRDELIKKAELLKEMIIKAIADSTLMSEHLDIAVTESNAQCGGGTLPDTVFKSFAVRIEGSKRFTDKLYKALLKSNRPVLAILRSGNIQFDVMAVPENELDELASVIADAALNISVKR